MDINSVRMLKTHDGTHLMVEDLQNINTLSHPFHLNIYILQLAC